MQDLRGFPSHNPPLSAWGLWEGIFHFSPSRPRHLRGLSWGHDLGFGCRAWGDGEWADRAPPGSHLAARRHGLQRPTLSLWTCFRAPPRSSRWIGPMSPTSPELRNSTSGSSAVHIPSLKGGSCHFSAFCIKRSPDPGSSHFPPALLMRRPLTSPTLLVLWSRVTPLCRWSRILWPPIFHPLWRLPGSPAPSFLPSRVGPLPLLSGSPTSRPVRQVWPSTRWPSFRPTRRTSWRRWMKGPAWLLKPWRNCAEPLTWLWEAPSTPHAPWGALWRLRWPQNAICGSIWPRSVRENPWVTSSFQRGTAAWGLFYGVWIFPSTKGSSRCWRWKPSCLRSKGGDWFVTIDLKDAYFHIQVVQRHRRFLRFAFGGKAYQYKVLPFGLALAPRTFTKCMDAALAPLRLQGIRVLNYLDDWLILAHSRELVSRHRDIVLGHIHSFGLRMNTKKSVLLPSQRTVFLGVRLDSVQMQARLAPARIPDFTACLARFKLGHHVSVGTCCRMLGLMAAASPVLPLGLLHMRPFLWWMKDRGPSKTSTTRNPKVFFGLMFNG